MEHKISVVIPVYNAQQTLQPLYERLCRQIAAQGGEFEIIFVEDCGRDDSWSVIGALAAKDARVRGFRMSRNFGQHNALLAGIREAAGDVVITMDDDLQHGPEEIPKLLDKLSEGYDVVYGTPEKERHGMFRDCASLLTKYVLQKVMGVASAGSVSAFRAFRVELRDAFVGYNSPTVNIDVLLSWATTRFGAVPVRHAARTVGRSGYSIPKLIRHALNMTTGFSILPLQCASLLGGLFALFGLAVLSYTLLHYFLYGSSVAGFTFLASIISIFSGIQLLSLGIIGEYLGRVHLHAINKPAYVIRQKTMENCDR